MISGCWCGETRLGAIVEGLRSASGFLKASIWTNVPTVFLKRRRTPMKPWATFCAGLIFILLFFVQGLFFIRANSPTYDEAKNLTAGYSHLIKNDFRLAAES